MILINNSFTNFLDFAVKPMPHPTADKLVALFVRAASHQLPHQQIFEKGQNSRILRSEIQGIPQGYYV